MSTLEMQVAALMRLCTAEREPERLRAREEIRGLLTHPVKRNRDPEREIRKIFLELGAPDHLAGHPYAVKAILLVMEDQTLQGRLSCGLYPRLAECFATTPPRVERGIRHLVEVTWRRGDMEVLNRYFGNTVNANRGKPTNGEFIARIANVVRQRMWDNTLS